MTAGPERDLDSRLADWVDGCLSERERERFVAELRVSPQLRQDLADYERTVADVRAALSAPTVPVPMADRVMAAIAAGERSMPTVRRATPRALLWSVACAAALLGLTLLVNAWQPTAAVMDVAANDSTKASPLVREALRDEGFSAAGEKAKKSSPEGLPPTVVRDDELEVAVVGQPAAPPKVFVTAVTDQLRVEEEVSRSMLRLVGEGKAAGKEEALSPSGAASVGKADAPELHPAPAEGVPVAVVPPASPSPAGPPVDTRGGETPYRGPGDAVPLRPMDVTSGTRSARGASAVDEPAADRTTVEELSEQKGRKSKEPAQKDLRANQPKESEPPGIATIVLDGVDGAQSNSAKRAAEALPLVVVEALVVAAPNGVDQVLSAEKRDRESPGAGGTTGSRSDRDEERPAPSASKARGAAGPSSMGPGIGSGAGPKVDAKKVGPMSRQDLLNHFDAFCSSQMQFASATAAELQAQAPPPGLVRFTLLPTHDLQATDRSADDLAKPAPSWEERTWFVEGSKQDLTVLLGRLAEFAANAKLRLSTAETRDYELPQRPSEGGEATSRLGASSSTTDKAQTMSRLVLRFRRPIR